MVYEGQWLLSFFLAVPSSPQPPRGNSSVMDIRKRYYRIHNFLTTKTSSSVFKRKKGHGGINLVWTTGLNMIYSQHHLELNGLSVHSPPPPFLGLTRQSGLKNHPPFKH